MATLYIMYGSATGNAEQIAKDLAASFQPDDDGFASCVCLPLEKFKKLMPVWEKEPDNSSSNNNCKKHGLLIVASTTGNGDAPENASRFVRFIKRKTTSPASFQHVAFSVLGLGDTNYDQFCQTGKVIDHRLAVDLGGTRIKPLACADEALGLEDVVEPWKETILQRTRQACFGQTASATTATSDQSAEGEKQMNGTHTAQSNGVVVVCRDGSTTTSVVQNGVSPSKTPVSSPSTTTNMPMEATTATTTTKVDNEEDFSSPAGLSNDDDVSPATPLIILYASATGNAEQIAKDLASTYETILSNPDSKCYFPSVICCAADEFKKRKLLETYWSQQPPLTNRKHGLLLVTSTTGNGDVPENGNRFSRWIKRKTTSPTTFQHVAYSVLGLGDTNYDQFCQAGVLVDKQLNALGGTRVLPLAKADEATGLEDVVEPWTNRILTDITNACRGEDTSLRKAIPSVKQNGTSSADGAVEPNSTPSTKPDTEPSRVPNSVLQPPSTPMLKGIDSVGVEILCGILSLDASTAIPCVSHTDLPSIGTSRSSCQLVDHEYVPRRSRGNSILSEMDRVTISSDTSSVLYRHNKPCERGILNARYLTKTPTEAAQEATQKFTTEADWRNNAKLIEAMEVYEKHFPLEPPLSNVNTGHVDYERNSKRVIELTISLPEDYTLEYKPGDSLGLLVPNLPQAIQFVLDMLKRNHNIPPDQPVSIDSNKPITVEEAVRSGIDLCTPLQKNHKRVLVALADHATEEVEALALRYLASKMGEHAFDTYIAEQRICFADILKDFPSCQSIPLEGLIGLLPAIPPRYYSVSSSPLESTPVPCLTIAFSVVDYLTPKLGNRGRRRIAGVATRYLEVLASPWLQPKDSANVSQPSSLPIFPKPTSDFCLPASVATPLVLIGPGTGIAPFIGFLKHREAQAAKSREALQQVVEGTWRGGYEIDDVEAESSNTGTGSTQSNSGTGPISVFYGCRHEDHDWLYKEELSQFETEGLITKLHTAFSRDGSDGRRQYVQDLMRESAKDQLVDLILNKQAIIYVCGDGNAMAKDVQATIVSILASTLGDEKEAGSYLDQMKKENRYVLDIWS